MGGFWRCKQVYLSNSKSAGPPGDGVCTPKEALFELVKAATLLNTPGMWMAWSDLRCFWVLYSLRTQQANQKRGSWILIRQDKSICFQQNSWEKSCKINWDGIWYLYRRYIFLRTSTPKIKLQKGAQYETFNTKNKPWIGGDSCV